MGAGLSQGALEEIGELLGRRGTGGVDAFSVGTGGALTKVGSVTVPDGAGGEGIVAW